MGFRWRNVILCESVIKMFVVTSDLELSARKEEREEKEKDPVLAHLALEETKL